MSKAALVRWLLPLHAQLILLLDRVFALIFTRMSVVILELRVLTLLKFLVGVLRWSSASHTIERQSDHVNSLDSKREKQRNNMFVAGHD